MIEHLRVLVEKNESGMFEVRLQNCARKGRPTIPVFYTLENEKLAHTIAGKLERSLNKIHSFNERGWGKMKLVELFFNVLDRSFNSWNRYQLGKARTELFEARIRMEALELEIDELVADNARRELTIMELEISHESLTARAIAEATEGN